MAIELHSFTVTLTAAEAAGNSSPAEFRSRIWKAVSDLSETVRAAGMSGEARVRSQDLRGHVLFEATDAGAAFLRSLPGIAQVENRGQDSLRVGSLPG